MEAALLALTAMNQQKHLILEMMKMENCNGARVGDITESFDRLIHVLKREKEFFAQ